jgi:hypothetical protein
MLYLAEDLIFTAVSATNFHPIDLPAGYWR